MMPVRRIYRRARRAALRTGLAALVLAAAWAAGLVWFAAEMPDAAAAPAAPVDAIVVLTGGSGRLSAGLHLLAQGQGRKLFVSGVYQGVEVAQLLQLAQQTPDEVECCIVLGYSADNTIGNAAETAQWMRAEGFRSLRLVTANYHIKRSLLEFRHAMPEVEMIPHPVFPDTVMQNDWWRWPGTAALIATEYNKYLAARLRHGAMLLAGRK